MSFEIRNNLAKIAIVLWIVFLVNLSLYVARYSVAFEPNAFFGLNEANQLPIDVIKEIKVLFLMLSVSIVGGVSFIIKDFYRSVKYANLYDRAYEDFRAGNISREGFQKLATVEIYSGRFNYTWIFWFLIQPILSSTLGIIAFFIARSGLGVITGSSTDPDISIKSLYLYAVFTFLAGFSSHKFIAWLDRLADKIFSTTLPEEKIKEGKAGVENASSGDRIALMSEISYQPGASNPDVESKISVSSESAAPAEPNPPAELFEKKSKPMKAVK